jgi:VWFA-related protein
VIVSRLAVVCGLVAGITAIAQEQLPRFRSGASLVTVDAYFTRNGVAVSDLKQSEIEILEDDRPQSIESFRIVRSRRASTSTPAPKLSAGAKPEVVTPSEAVSRTFVLFFDTWHVSREGSSRAAGPVSELVNRVVGDGDRVGVLTPDQSARSLDLTGRGSAIERMVRATAAWGQRDRIDLDPREREIDMCYPEDPRRPQYRGIAKEMIERRREQKTLRALDDLIVHLAGQGDERKFVVILSEGWVQFRQNEALAAVLDAEVPAGLPEAATPIRKPQAYDRARESCERERASLAFLDHSLEIRLLAQRANRANVTFYAIDPRGLTPFDDSIGPMRHANPEDDRTRMASRQGGLRELAGNTDGAVVLNTTDVKTGVARMLADLDTYYLMQYYSTNLKLDGRFRAITVRVKRPGVRVRARPGYLAATETDARGPGTSAKPPELPEGVIPINRRPPVTALRRGPSTGLAYVRADEARFRRSERLRIEMPLPEGASEMAGRILTVQGQALPLPVTSSTVELNGQTIIVADVTLAPLAVGRYALELSYDVRGAKERAVYEFQIVP